MANILGRLRGLFGNRRKRDEPRDDDRRGGGGRGDRMKAAEKKADAALDELNRTVRMRREDFMERAAQNDHQQVVIFSTFREICQQKGPELGAIRLCRHPSHPDAANAHKICDENKCPKIMLALKGAA